MPPPLKHQRCAWCDAFGHLKSTCLDLSELLKSGAVKYNEKKRLIETKSGFEFPLLFGRGGMRALYHGRLKVLELLSKEGGLEYLQAQLRYEERIEELRKALGDEYWKYIDPIPPIPPQ